MIIAQRPDGIRILRITRPEEAITYRASFAGAYQDIFSEAPYNERINRVEAGSILSLPGAGPLQASQAQPTTDSPTSEHDLKTIISLVHSHFADAD